MTQVRGGQSDSVHITQTAVSHGPQTIFNVYRTCGKILTFYFAMYTKLLKSLYLKNRMSKLECQAQKGV